MASHSKSIEEIVDEISDQAFQIPSAPWPGCNAWWKIDYVEDGKIILKQVDIPA